MKNQTFPKATVRVDATRDEVVTSRRVVTLLWQPPDIPKFHMSYPVLRIKLIFLLALLINRILFS